MAKSKDRLMLEELFKAASNTDLYQDSCEEGKDLLKKLAKHLNKPLSDICGDPISKGLIIYVDEFEIPDFFDEDCSAEDAITVDVIVKRNGKKIETYIDSFYWN